MEKIAFMPLFSSLRRLFLFIMTASIIFSVGCSYIPWIQKDEDDLAFEEDFPFDDIREGGESRD